MTANDLINSALRLINVLGSGEIPSGTESNDALFVLNAMIDGWQIERLMVFTIQRQVFTPATLKQVYTFGANGDFNAPRPPKIDRAAVLVLGNPIQPLELPIELVTDASWQAIPVKNISAAIPLKAWDDQQFPLRNISYWPIPNVAVNFVFYAWTALTQFPDLVTDLTFPPGYQAAFRYNLALRLAIEFNRGTPPEIRELAEEAKRKIKGMNTLPIDLRCDPALTGQGGKYNWLTDSGGRR